MVSVVERNDLDDFLYNAEIAMEKFEAVKAPKMIITEKLENQVVINLNQNVKHQISDEEKNAVLTEMKYSRIPRRPKWDGVRDVDEQKVLEANNFINWRRKPLL